jgi:hypothetical protein
VSSSSNGGSTISMNFTGHDIAVVVPRGPTRGAARVSIDGVYAGTIWEWQRTSASRQVLFTRAFASGGAHRITLTVLGGGPHPSFRLDAFVVVK